MHLFRVLAKAAPCLLLCAVACTPKATPTLDREPINGITESISEGPVTPPVPLSLKPLTPEHPLYLTPAEEARIDSLLSVMTVEEKAGQMNQYTSFYDVTGPAPSEGSAQARFEQIRNGLVGSMLNVTGAAETRKVQELALESRLGIPVIFGFDVIHGFETQFPVPLAEAATFDLGLIEQGARYAAEEASAHGVHWTFAPMVDVSPDARWGRIVEGAGEDPFYGAQVAAARVRGFQGDDLASASSIAACVKHLAGYGYGAAGRDYNAADVSDYTLYNDILPPFRAAAEAGAATFMNSFNTLAGVPATGDKVLQRDWLKGQLGWPGFIVSDWNSIGEMVAHGAVENEAAAALKAVRAGSDMDMETRAYVNYLPALVAMGTLDEGLLDDAVRRILRVKTALGLFDDPFRYCDPEREAAVTADPALRAAAVETAAASAVLLQNEGGLLPLAAGQRAVLIGDLAADKDSPLGTWSLAAERNTAVSLREAMATVGGAELPYAAGPSTLVPGSKREFLFELSVNTTDRSGIDEAVAAARGKDVVVMALGEPGFMSGEARSRADITLPGFQTELFEAVHAVNPNIVVVLYTGRPLALGTVADSAKAILVAWQPGSYGNEGIAEVLYGRRDATGRLPVSFPYTVGQEPLTYREYATGRPGPAAAPTEQSIVFNSHYMDAPRTAQYPFGHGLSYTDFEVGPVTLSQNNLDAGGDLVVTTTVRNTGERAGTHTVQLYTRDPVATRVRPLRELKGFERVTLAPGASETLTFRLSPKHLQYWTPERGWHVEAGTFEVYVGGSSAELGEALEVEVAGVAP